MHLADYVVISVIWQAGEMIGFVHHDIPLDMIDNPRTMEFVFWYMQRAAEDRDAPIPALHWECHGRPWVFDDAD